MADSVTPGQVRRRSGRAALPTGWGAVLPARGDRTSPTPDREQPIEPLDESAGDGEDRAGERGDPGRDVSELDAVGDNDHDVHDVHDMQEDSDESDDGHDVHDVHDVHDIQGDDDDDDSDDDDDEDSNEGSDEGSEDDDDDIHTDSGEGDDSDDDADSDDEGGTDGGGDGSDDDEDSDDEDSDDDVTDSEGGYEYAREGLDAARFRVAYDRPGRTGKFGTPDIRLGVIGCGETAEASYLPQLSSLPDATVTAITDLSRERVERVGDRYGVAHRYQRGETLITEHRTDLDGVVICTPPHTHADLAVQALDAGLATFVEAPLALRPEDASTLLTLVEQSTVPAMVGYTRRYDPAYQQFESVLERRIPVRHVDAYDVTPVDPRTARPVSDPASEALPQAVAADADRIRTGQAKDALGTDTDWIADEYLSHLEQLCHDVNVLRGLYGDVAEIDHVSLDGPGEFLTATLGYEGGTECHLTSGRIDGEWSEEYVRVDTADSVVRFDCSDPYYGHSPSAVTIKEGTDEVVTRTHVPTVEEPVERALGAFLEAIRTGKPTQTPFADAAKDVALIAELVERGTVTE
ncbi:Gfo/Idh/MocA family protein [Halosimplex salinum]|uniref:Gfo/Idh/MocA family protein n=1 Tax=Halosimplex salinum TaxID=1710538 RepID=UPI000F49D4B1|nr:Gfo/Idh/MocA family oxidoreductase [Halosimplex salinum]